MNSRPRVRRQRRVEFADTDASGRAHFTALLRHVEAVEHELLAELGLPRIGPDGGWPRVRIECDYRAPVSAGDSLEVTVEPLEVGDSSVKWRFLVERTGGGEVAEGRMITVRVDAAGRPSAIPDAWRSRLGG